MDIDIFENSKSTGITISEEVSQYILEKKNNFRVCTSCGGPVILSTLVKPPKPSDLEIYVGDYILYVSIYQARFIDRIDINMIPRFSDYI
ncbi:hypothetical protein L1994_04460 [Methanomicrobium antiquum]|uniref:Uncharacterized protein n=1 Tax=Methanomicrobium antiquum TaxID=487686 RepID=A0AAF0JNR2_9EURY|nr:hypothetical protein [Methanomicrobium antiquum]MDD3978005.1 hypothetical protein [Methanomicrobium sp.]WFN37646.1 hypothetical protein L1994_04460 [Methanomicrobium antiquum]